jgi:hypothetical protein
MCEQRLEFLIGAGQRLAVPALSVNESVGSVNEVKSDRQVLEPVGPGLRRHPCYESPELGDPGTKQIDAEQARNLVLESRAASSAGERVCIRHSRTVWRSRLRFAAIWPDEQAHGMSKTPIAGDVELHRDDLPLRSLGTACERRRRIQWAHTAN